jgi:hypothetical protein
MDIFHPVVTGIFVGWQNLSTAKDHAAVFAGLSSRPMGIADFIVSNGDGVQGAIGWSVYDTERLLLYVACTRARDHLLLSGVSPTSEFLDDLADQ